MTDEPTRELLPTAGGLPPAAGPVLAWRFPEPVRCVSSAVLGGGIGFRRWVLNVEVGANYRHPEPEDHVAEIAETLGLHPEVGVGLLTAAPVRDVVSVTERGARCDATVGITRPTWAADSDGAWEPWRPDTINLVCWVPAPLSDAALVNAVITVTEAKTQALADLTVPGTGTASDAVVVTCPQGRGDRYGGPRSAWGSRLARAVYGAVVGGADRGRSSG